MRAMPSAVPVTLIAAVLASGCGASASASPKSVNDMSTPLKTTLGWFRAINEKSPHKAKSYLEPSARYMMDWGPTSNWSTFTKLHCKTLSKTRTHASVKCTFHESASPSEGNPDTFWSVNLRLVLRKWLIDNYGQP